MLISEIGSVSIVHLSDGYIFFPLINPVSLTQICLQKVYLKDDLFEVDQKYTEAPILHVIKAFFIKLTLGIKNQNETQ